MAEFKYLYGGKKLCHIPPSDVTDSLPVITKNLMTVLAARDIKFMGEVALFDVAKVTGWSFSFNKL